MTTLVGRLCGASPAEAATYPSVLDGGYLLAITRHDHRAHRLAPEGVGGCADRDLGHGRVAGQRLFDFPSRDILAAPNDDVLHPVGHDEIAVFIEAGQVAGAEPGAIDECVGVRLPVLVSEELFGPAGDDLTFLTGTTSRPSSSSRRTSLPGVTWPSVLRRLSGGSAGPPELMAGCSVEP